MRESEGNINLTSSHFDKYPNSMSRKSEEAVDADAEIVCIGDQRCGHGHQSDKESIKTDKKIFANQLPSEEVKEEGEEVLSSDDECEEIMANIEERLQNSLCLDQQNCKEENISGKNFLQAGQRNCDVSQPQRNETDFTAASIIYEASICHEEKAKELKTEHRPPSQLGSSAENSSQVNASSGKLHVDLEHCSHFDSRSSYREAANVLNQASERGDCTKLSNKEGTVDGNMAKSSEDEGNSSGSQSEEESSVDSNESDEGSDGLEFDKHETSERANEQGQFLPSIEEDFEEYLENVSKSIEKLPHPGEFSDDGGIYSEYKLHSDFKDDHYDETPTDAYVTSQQFNILPDTCYQMSHQDSPSIGHRNEQFVQAYHDNRLSEGGWNYLSPYTGFCNQCDWFSNHNYMYYHDQSYNNYYPFLGNRAANWQANAQRHPDSASSQQYLDQIYGDSGSSQDHQWNTSWYNAYQRQTGCIRQFVSFSRSATF